MAHKLLNAVTATGPGSSIFLQEKQEDHTVQIEYIDANASISALVVNLEGSLDGRDIPDASAQWFVLDTYTFDAAALLVKKGMFHTLSKLVTRVRLNLVTATGIGAGDSVSAKYQIGGV